MRRQSRRTATAAVRAAAASLSVRPGALCRLAAGSLIYGAAALHLSRLIH